MTLAVVFPGQGSQSVGMLADSAAAYPEIPDTFEQATRVLGKDLWALAQTGPAEALADTRVTQPLMFVADVAMWRVLRAAGLAQPVAVAGHSLGQLSALVAAGSLQFHAGLELVQKRADLMATAVPDGEGGMAAVIGVDDETVIAVCSEVTAARTDGHIVEAVNFNAPGQVVLSGHLDAVDAACELVRERGARRAMLLPVSVPNHSSLMKSAGEQFALEIDKIEWSAPELPVVLNADASTPATLEQLLASLRQHLSSPVNWTANVEALRDVHGADRLLECGPGKVLAGLAKRIDKRLPCVTVDSAAETAAAISELASSGESA